MSDLQQDLASPRARVPWRTAVALAAVIFVSGVVLGTSVGFALAHARFDGHPPPHDKMPEMIIGRIRKDLRLNQEQVEKVAVIVRESHGRLEALRMQVEPDVHAEMEAMQRRVREVLTPSQQTVWDARCREMRERRPFSPGAAPGSPQPNP